MKRTVNGVLAYGKMIGTALPEKTASYTPISHASVINRVRSEITSAGYIITGEDYRCSNDGQVAIGTFRMNYKDDPDIELSANFMNSYNKQFAFRFNLGGMVKVCENGMMLNNNKFGSYRRVHTGAADLLAEGKISEFINDSGDYWDSLVKHKDYMKDLILDDDAMVILGKLFFEEKILTTFQMNTIRKEWEKPSFDYKVPPNSAWALYNHITLSLKDSHPSTWIDDQIKCHDVFYNVLGLPQHDEEEEDAKTASASLSLGDITATITLEEDKDGDPANWAWIDAESEDVVHIKNADVANYDDNSESTYSTDNVDPSDYYEEEEEDED
jgi:hypothetical protein